MVWFVSVAAAIAILALLTAFICYMKVFYAPPFKKPAEDEYEIPEGEIYEAFRDEMVGWVKEVRAMGGEHIMIKSFDGLLLSGMYYEYEKGAVTELLFHGYQGYAERDLSGGVKRCFALGRNALIIDQRAHGESDGMTITFGINEAKDCLSWIDYAVKRFGDDCKLIITGISMGASTVMMAAGEKLPENVVCVLADCGYTSAKEIIKKVIDEMGLPSKLLYPFVKLGAKTFGGFDPDANSPLEAMKRCKVPVIFIHGEADDYVPEEMSRINYEACNSKKELVLIPGAGHGLAYPVAPEQYVEAMKKFFYGK
jgi:fermentation-respiration switch protein FrsA (DUF1100 family)